LRRAKLPTPEALQVAVQVCAALSAAHAEGIVHRDIKLENVMLRHDGYVKVLDFGIAKLAAPLQSDGISQGETMATVETRAGVVFGTTSCMSPEQARGLPVDVRSDIFSFGVLLYELFTGQKPFDGPSTTDIMVAILDRDSEAPEPRHRGAARVARRDRHEVPAEEPGGALPVRRRADGRAEGADDARVELVERAPRPTTPRRSPCCRSST
jgi:eukaryotic-like serine/threonine-protein kinase